jgi:hypothetical protein
LSIAFLALVLLLGIPSLLVHTAPSDGPVTMTTAAQEDPFLQVVASRSTLHRKYEAWETLYTATGGDANVRIGLGYIKGLSTETLPWSGEARLDLLAGDVEIAVAEAAGLPLEAWLVDNQPHPGDTVLPEPGDRMVRLGRLDANGRVELSLGEEFFRSFEVDLVVISRAGEDPTTARLLLGGRPLFERLYTQTRTAALNNTPRTALGKLASLGAVFAPTPAHAAPAGLVSTGLVSRLVARGGDLFLRGTFGGNGRSCGTCHPIANDQVVEAAFIATLPSSDPIFIAEKPAAEGGVPGLEIPVLMRQFGLILENVDGFEPDPTVRFVMRAVPHSLSQDTSVLAPADGRAPVERTGWSGDGAPITGALRFFPTGAVTQHYPKTLKREPNIDFVLPTDAQLDRMEAFMRTSGRTNDLVLTNVTVFDEGAEAGRQTFLTAGCNACHGNAGANASFAPGNRNFDTGVEALANPAQAVHPHPKDGGFGTAENTPGIFGDGTFNTPPLVEAADTGPFFHNNTIESIEDAVRFYSGPEFAASPSGQVAPINLTEQENLNVAAFLRVINAAFNVDQAAHRADAALTLLTSSSTPSSGVINTARGLLRFANEELRDANEVLDGRGLLDKSSKLIEDARKHFAAARNETHLGKKIKLVEDGLKVLAEAKKEMGNNLNFEIGEGNLMF